MNIAAALMGIPTPTPTIENPSRFQLDIFDAVESASDNLVVEAVAGSGKTTTMLAALPRAAGERAFFAFNKSIADELRSRVPTGVLASTFHSFGFAACRRAEPKVASETRKVGKLFRKFSREDEGEYYSPVTKLVSHGKNAGVGVIVENEPGIFAGLIDYHDLNIGDCDSRRLIDLAMRITRASLEDRRLVDFDDMLLHPLAHNYPIETFDWVFVDESQDLNSLQRELCARARGHRICAVGDSYQAIYGFRGASFNSMDLFREDFSAVTLPLSISYRCPQVVVEMAQQYCPTIQAAPTAPEGTFIDLGVDWCIENLTETRSTAVLCRLNRPILALAFQLFKLHIPCHILGREIGEGLIALAQRTKTDDIVEMIRSLTVYRESEVAKLLAADKDGEAARLIDKVDAILAVASDCNTVSELVELIRRMFDQANGGITLSTVHKSKGLEWETVFILDRGLMPSKFAKTEEALRQESNLIYVAYTRAKRNLRFIDSKKLS